MASCDRREFSKGALAALGAAMLPSMPRPADAAIAAASFRGKTSIERIRHWVVVMFENRSFDNLLGHLPHIDAQDGIRGREIHLPYPGGSVRVHPTTNFTDPIPDPGECYPDVNVQLFGQYRPAANAGKSGYPIFPDFMTAPFNAPVAGAKPTMDGFALDFHYNGLWLMKRKLSDTEMRSIGGVYTPATAPVINTLAREYAVFTHWHCDAPTCTFPNRTFFFAGTSAGRLDNELTYDYGWDNDLPNLFGRLTEKGVDWRCYYPRDQVVPMCSINLGGLHHLDLWREHAVHMEQFFADCANGALPAFSWVEPAMLLGNVEDYHPPTDIRAGEAFLARVFEAIRSSPQWESTALVVMFDEHGGCYDHVPPPSTVAPDESRGAMGFAFDRLGVRIPTIVVSPYTERGTVIRDLHSNTSMTRSLREQLGLGPAFTRRDAAAATIEAAFNRSEPRRDRVGISPLPYVAGAANAGARTPLPADSPDSKLLERRWDARGRERISELGEATLRNAARLLHEDASAVPRLASEARAWLEQRFLREGRFGVRL